MMRIAIHGTGRMAAAISRAVADRDDVTIVAVSGPKAPDWSPSPPWYSTLEGLPELPELLIDFTLPAGTLAAAGWCERNRVPLLSGVTGLPPATIDALKSTAVNVPVLWSPNLSLGVNLLADLVARAASVLDADIPVVIEDIHHQWKKDAPSGTALMLGQAIAGARDGDDSGVKYQSVREGEIVGRHSVTFQLAGEEISLVHNAHDRNIYALGALEASAWLSLQAPGLYTAADWLSGRIGAG